MQPVILDATVFEHVGNGGNGTQFTKTPNSSDGPLWSAPAVSGLVERLRFSQRTLT